MQVWDFVQNCVYGTIPPCPYQVDFGGHPRSPQDGLVESGVIYIIMADPEYHRQYWKNYKKKTRQISLTVSVQEYKMWKDAAERQGRRSVGQQIKAEALAYREQEHLPELDTQNYLAELIRILRGIGNNINQIAHHSNAFGRVMKERDAIANLKKLEQVADGFIRQVKR